MKYIVLILLTGCTTWNASFTGRVVDVKTEGKSRFEMRLATGIDTVTCKVRRFQRPRIGQKYLVRYDTVCTDKGRKATFKRIK